MTRHATITHDTLNELLHYDMDTGLFTWLVARGKATCGVVAGRIDHQGYRIIVINGRKYRAHRLAWFLVYGSFPKNGLDHINGDKLDNRIENLRDVSPSVNSQNFRQAHSDNPSGVIGVCWDASRRKWLAQICTAGVRKHLGRFDSLDAARQAYLEAKRQFHPGCTI